MTIRIVIHQAEEGGYWTEVPVIPGRASQGDKMDELLANIREAIEGCLLVDVALIRQKSSWPGQARPSREVDT